ncbi:MAG: hypothetical protein ACI4VC_03045 [Clostridia bacterium]
MKVRDLIDTLEQFDEDMEVRIGMLQRYGSNFAMDIEDEIAIHNINSFYGEDINAVVLTEGSQVGTVDYDI